MKKHGKHTLTLSILLLILINTQVNSQSNTNSQINIKTFNHLNITYHMFRSFQMSVCANNQNSNLDEDKFITTEIKKYIQNNSIETVIGMEEELLCVTRPNKKAIEVMNTWSLNNFNLQ